MTESARPPLGALTLACAVARVEMDEHAAERLDAAMAGVADWAMVPPVLVRHGLLALAAIHLAPRRAAVPDAVWTTLETESRRARALALAGAGELGRIAGACAAARIPMLALKGPVLGWRAYGDIGARPFTDLDLLVPPAAAPHTLDLLRELGYAAEYRFTPRQDAWFRQADGDYPLVHAETGRMVELHARPLTRRFAGLPRFEVLWERRVTAPLGDREVFALGDDDAFLLQALHGGKHRWERLEWVAAVGELLRRRGGEIGPLLATAPEGRRALLLAAEVAATWVGAARGPRTLAACRRDALVPALADRAWRRVASGAVDEGSTETAGKLRFNFRLQRGVKARLRFAYRWAFWPSPEDWQFLRLPDPFFFVYRVVRPLRLLGRYLRRAPTAEAARG